MDPEWPLSRTDFEFLLENTVIATMDLILDTPDGVLLLRRRIPPYRGRWALPGRRLYRNESVDECLARIAHDELGLTLATDDKELVSQAIARFRTELGRQDLSTCYALRIDTMTEMRPNAEHVSGTRFVRGLTEVPAGTGALYRNHLQTFFARSA